MYLHPYTRVPEGLLHEVVERHLLLRLIARVLRRVTARGCEMHATRAAGRGAVRCWGVRAHLVEGDLLLHVIDGRGALLVPRAELLVERLRQLRALRHLRPAARE